MPRKRMLHPGFFESHNLSDIDDIAALLTYQGVWVFGDDRGRILDDIDALWLKVWPHRRQQVQSEDVAAHINALVDGEQLCRYQLGGGRFLHVIAWDEHQKISHATPSKLPPCPEHQPLEYKAWWKDIDTATDRWRKAEKAGQAARITPESLASNSGETPERLTEELTERLTHSVVQISSVQSRANLAKNSGKKPTFERRSQTGGTS